MCAAVPIPTRYKGYHFRSRLEARWAVFFDRLALGWEYEPQGYVLDGTPYLPDFKLVIPGDRVVLAEVKPAGADWHEGRHVKLCWALARGTGCPVTLLVGAPAYRAYHQFTRTWKKAPSRPCSSAMTSRRSRFSTTTGGNRS